ncbi:MAG: hypothetical protein ACR2MX_19295 [Cyclobacteriaceae bacterium]
MKTLKLLLTIIVVGTLGFFSCDTGNEVVEPPVPIRKNVLILSDEGTETGVQGIYSSTDFDAFMGGNYWEFDGSNLANYDLVILLSGVNYAEEVSEEVQLKLIEYVNAGGTLLTTEWITYYSSLYPILYQWSPVKYDGEWGVSGESYTVMTDHTITKDLPATFTLPENWSYSKQTLNTEIGVNATTLIEGSESASALSIRKIGNGHNIHWSMAGAYGGTDIWSDEAKQILINIGDFAVGN